MRDCILFVKWLDGAFAHNARSGRSIYKPHPPVSRCIGYMRDTKGYSVKKSAYAFVPVSEGNVLAPVWLQPDPTDRSKERKVHCHEKQRRWRFGIKPRHKRARPPPGQKKVNLEFKYDIGKIEHDARGLNTNTTF